MSIEALLDNVCASACAAAPRRWTDNDLAFLEAELPRLGYGGVAARLGRTTEAVKIVQVRRQIPANSKRPGFYSANQVAWLLNIDIHAVTVLEARGLLRFQALPGLRAIRQIGRTSLWVWAIHPEHWLYFKPQRVRDPRLRRLIELRKEKWGDEWWTTARVARHYGLARPNTVDAAIYRGRLKATRWGNWYVRRSDALACHFTAGQGSAGYTWSARADAFLVKARDEWGLSWAAIGRLMKWTPQRACYRYRLLKGKQ